MENISLSHDGIGLLKLACFIAAGATLGAYTLLRHGFVAAVIALLAVSYAWVRYVGGGIPINEAGAMWYVPMWVCTLAFIGLLRVSAMMQSGRLRLFGSDLIDKD